MLSRLAESVSPKLADGYQTLLERWMAETLPGPDLAEPARAYGRYAVADALLPRPLLMMIGYGADRDRLDESVAAELGDLVFIPQVIRDLLAIHDDVVDGDLIKFGQPTLPAAFAALAPTDHPEPGSFGKQLALYWGDLLYGLLGEVINYAESVSLRKQLSARVSELIRRTQRGQLRELILQQKPPRKIRTETLLTLYADKAADYCYMAPIDLGAICGGLDPERRRAAGAVLEPIGTASQIIDDIAGGCPQALDHDRDTLGEIVSLRRTVLLCELARALPADHPLTPIVAGQHATVEQAADIRAAFIRFGIVSAAAGYAAGLARRANARIADLGFAEPATEYLYDLVKLRITDSLELLTHPVDEKP